MNESITLAALQQMKREGRKIVAAVVYDYQMAVIVDRAGVDIVSVGDSVGINLWGHESESDVTLDQMLLVCRAVRKGVERALLSCDFPFASLGGGIDSAVQAATLLVQNGGADLIKVDAAADFLEVVRAMTRAGIAVWAQFGITPHTAARYGGMATAGPAAAALTDRFVAEARLLEEAGAVLLDFTNSGTVAGPEVSAAVSIPVIGGLGGGPWLDGRVRSVFNAIGYSANAVDDATARYANVARIALEAITAYADDVRASRQILGEPPARIPDPGSRSQ